MRGYKYPSLPRSGALFFVYKKWRSRTDMRDFLVFAAVGFLVDVAGARTHVGGVEEVVAPIGVAELA
jgi:hypothetical protein